MSSKNVPGDRSAYLVPVPDKGFRDLRMKEPGFVGDFVATRAMMAIPLPFLITLLLAMDISRPDGDLGPFGIPAERIWDLSVVLTLIATFVATYAVTLGVFAFGSVRSHLRIMDANFVQNAKSRVHAVINRNADDQEDVERAYFARALITKPDEQPFGRELLVRLDAIAVRLDEAVLKTSHDEKLERRARDVAYRASMDLIGSIRIQAAAHLDVAAVDDLTRDVRAIVDGREVGTPALSYAPSARISRIIATAERMLASHPDLADAGGARIDALVRVHVPRLLERHRIAAETASPDALDAVDAQLETGVEAIRRSVQEAADAVHDEAMTGLATELRFLELRRASATPLLTVAS